MTEFAPAVRANTEEFPWDDIDDVDDGDDYDPGEDCGRWNNGRLTKFCRLAGTEFCDWECPYGI